MDRGCHLFKRLLLAKLFLLKNMRNLVTRWDRPRILRKERSFFQKRARPGPTGTRVVSSLRWKECAVRTKRLTLQQRRDIFHDLVLTQDMVTNVPRSRKIVTEKFEITETQLRQIEEEGLEKEWPPLSEAVQEQEV